MYIPLTKPYWGKAEERAAVEALRHSSGAGDGSYTKQLAGKLTKLTGMRYAIPVTSCTHGLELAMAALGIGPGDEVIVPSFTMTSTANCVVLRGATPVFADIEPLTYGLSVGDVARRITERTKGVIFVPYAGMPGDIRAIRALCRERGLFLVEDAAHAIGAYDRGKHLGTFGDIGVFSFHGTKNVSCGEGGAVVTDRKDLYDTMEIYRANGTNRTAFLAGIVDKYSWVGKGTSYFLSDILANIVSAQLDHITTINKKRNQIALYYSKQLQHYAGLFDLPRVPPGAQPNWHIYAVLFKKKTHRDLFLREMRKRGIDAAYHYVPLHSSRMGRKLAGSIFDQGQLSCAARRAFPSTVTAPETGKRRVLSRFFPQENPQGDPFLGVPRTEPPAVPAPDGCAAKSEPREAPCPALPVTDFVWERLVRLPIYPGLTSKQLQYVVQQVRETLQAYI
ncbi:aminotransferase class I/II-fold pyridoxal phosphate-dependent enzyme [Patescibacteria group bacterium]|nr:aminotransferase class I/II-fold pyridoxal phosphate-dependent enzyme [Patescibacteria group bacterium]